MAGEVGTDKICPLVHFRPIKRDGKIVQRVYQHCLDNCEWNDGEGCAVWRIVKALEKIATAQAPMERQ